MHILNVARACLFQSNLPHKFWEESILTAIHLINRTPTLILYDKSPYEVLYGTHLLTLCFVCLDVCVTHITGPGTRISLVNEVDVVFLLVILMLRKDGEYMIWRKISSLLVARLCFKKMFFPFAELEPTPIIPPSVTAEPFTAPPADFFDNLTMPGDSISNPHVVGEPSAIALTSPPVTTTPEVPTTPLPLSSPSHSLTVPIPPIALSSSPEPVSRVYRNYLVKDITLNSLRFKLRVTSQILFKLHRLYTPNAFPPGPSNPSSSSTVSGKTCYPLTTYLSDSDFSEIHKVFMAAITNSAEPTSYHEASLNR